MVFFIMILGLKIAEAQDLHYSQFYNAPLNINPGLTGIFNGDQRVTLSFRDQGRSIPVPYLTFSASYDHKILPKKSKNGFFGVGAFFNYDKQGDSNLRLINLNLAGSYSRIINERNILTIGGLIGYANRGFDPAALTWDSQWDTRTNSFNSSLGSGETFSFESFGYLETGLGLNYRWQKTQRTKLDVGIGGFHLTSPQSRFNDAVDQKLPLRLSAYAIYTKELNADLDLQLDAMYQLQGEYREMLLGAYLNFYLNQTRGKERQFRVGGGYKTTADVLFIKAGIQINEWFLSASYDIDLSETASQHVGASGRGPELHLRYIIKHVKPLGKFKTCPIF
ncbi:MAG: PorP/SprF family type IX secretion system membrane protein [Saprospiraceae bacterium]|nr:PorP/SprF family type IX secretion system membrane protein [Bacteroidia bacterium]NNL91572.1 PorP/SprF family type IX secretion system membrane protein [Saprospiraceae bacterium]